MATRNRTNVVLWIITGILAVAYFSVGAAMFVGRMNAVLVSWGYTEGSGAMVGILAMAGAIGLLFVRTAGWAAIALIVLSVGAVWTLAVHQQWMVLIGPLVGILGLVLVAWGRGLTWATRNVGAPSEIANT
jgi:hypothetical protein